MILKRGIPTVTALSFGLLTLVGLLLPLPGLNDLILTWAGFLAAVALLLGVLNLLHVHINRLWENRNLYSGVLVLSMLAVFGLAISDTMNLTDNGVGTVFTWIQAPLEAALASLLAFFLLVAGFQLLKRRRSLAAVLFLLTIVFILFSNALLASQLLPAVSPVLAQMRNIITSIVVTAGMRGLLLGIALGTITLSLRLLAGSEQPYNR